MTFDEIKKELEQNAKSSQNPYYTKVVPNSKPCIGVKVPVLRSLAKKIAKSDYRSFLRDFPEDYLEHQTLKAFVLGYAKDDIDTILEYATAFLPSIQDWMVNDAFCQTFSIARKYPEPVWNWLMQYVEAGKPSNDSQSFDPSGEYLQRVVAVTLMSHYLNDEYYRQVLEVLPKLTHPAYYTKMGVAWAVATAYAKYPAATKVLLDEQLLDPWTHNKSIQKMIESYRVSNSDKDELRLLKRKHN